MENRILEIQECQKEVRELTRRIAALSTRVDALERNTGAEVRAEHAGPVVPAPAAQVPVQEEPAAIEGKRHENLENTVGRNLFAVLASVLVLLGVGVFISTIYEYIPQTVKILAIYFFGFVLLGAGLVLYRKNGNKFWLGVASCGLAELLVSIITSHSYFAVLSLPATFALILVWIIGSFWLTRFQPTVFKTIGYIGFIISMLLGLNLLTGRDTLIYMTLLGAYAVLSVFFMVTNGSFVTMNTAMAFASVFGLCMFQGMPAHLPEGWDWVSGAVALVILGVFHGVYLLRAGLSRRAYPLYAMASVLVLSVFLARYQMVQVLSVLLGAVFVLWYGNHRLVENRATRIFYAVFAALYLLALSWTYQESAGWAFYSWYGAFAAGAYLLYYLTQSREVAWMGLACFVAFWRFAAGEEPAVHILAFSAAAGIFALNSGGVLRKDEALETAWYVLVFLMAHALRDDVWGAFYRPGVSRWEIRETVNAVFFTLLALGNTFCLHISTADKDRIMKVTARGVVLMVLQGYLFINSMTAVDSGVWFASLLGVASSMLILSHSLWYTYKIGGRDRKLTVWQFVKFSLYCALVLAILDSPSILVNISLLLIAILAIVMGFRLGHKAVRVYGLILSLLDVVCLVLFNIDYSDSLQLAGGIILCGALCFVISFIYSRISKTKLLNQRAPEATGTPGEE